MRREIRKRSILIFFFGFSHFLIFSCESFEGENIQKKGEKNGEGKGDGEGRKSEEGGRR